MHATHRPDPRPGSERALVLTSGETWNHEHFGMCDASAAVAVGDDYFVVANDEDNILRVYRNDVSAGPVQSFDWSAPLDIADDDDHPEADIEAAARVGDRVYWVTSHGTNKNGKPRPNRRRFFATDLVQSDGQIRLVPVGNPYKRLLEELDAHPPLSEFNLADRGMEPPESDTGLNIEGLAPRPDGTLLIAFRNPIPDGKALLVPLKNPDGVVRGTQRPRLGMPILLDLDGLGVRCIQHAPGLDAYLIVAGSHRAGGIARLFRWSGAERETPTRMPLIGQAGANIEALVAPLAEDRTDFLALSDDGDLGLGGTACKQLPPEKRRFRSWRIGP
jgi:Protein of unknown function (DUF3616)